MTFVRRGLAFAVALVVAMSLGAGSASATGTVAISGITASTVGVPFTVDVTTTGWTSGEYSAFAGGAQVTYELGATIPCTTGGATIASGATPYAAGSDGVHQVSVGALSQPGTWYFQAELSPSYKSDCVAVAIAPAGGGTDTNTLPPTANAPAAHRCPKGKKLRHGKCVKKKKKKKH